MGFSPRTETLLTRANVICEGRGVRLTDLRRQVLGLILDRDGADRRLRPAGPASQHPPRRRAAHGVSRAGVPAGTGAGAQAGEPAVVRRVHRRGRPRSRRPVSDLPDLRQGDRTRGPRTCTRAWKMPPSGWGSRSARQPSKPKANARVARGYEEGISPVGQK